MSMLRQRTYNRSHRVDARQGAPGEATLRIEGVFVEGPRIEGRPMKAGGMMSSRFSFARPLLAVPVAAMAIGACFLWGYQTHRTETFPYTVLSWFLVDTDAKPYSWIRPHGRPLSNLRSLAYVGANFDPESDRRGVQVHDPELAWEGLNFYYSAFEGPFLLIDMDGREVRRWSDSGALVSHAELLPDAGLIVVRFDKQVVRLDSESRPRWVANVRAHHDVAIHGDDLWTLSRRERPIPALHPTQDILEDTVTVLSLETGEVREELSLLDVVRSSPYRFLLASVAGRAYVAEDGPLDTLHTNHVSVFDGSLVSVSPLFGAGNVLLSMRHLNAIMILDGSTREVLWIWGPSNLYGQHHPTLLSSGRLLVFDNGVASSRVLEVDPLSNEIGWSYASADFHTPLRGSAQRLANGNTLITESDAGRVFEVTTAGDIVWEFVNPDVTEAGERSVIWRMMRVPSGDWKGS